MKKISKKTKITTGIAIAIVALVATAVVAYLFITQKQDETAVESEIALSETPNLGACSLVSPEEIKNLERVDGGIKTISEGTRIGIKTPEGTVADACRYTFTTSMSSDNTLTIAAYNAPVQTENTPPASTGYSWSEAAGTSPQIYFAEKKDDDEKEVTYFARQPLGGVVLLVSMTEPADAAVFPKGAGMWILADIAQTADTAALNEKNDAQLNANDGPGAPPATTKAEKL